MEVNNILDKVKELVRKGNVSKIVLRRKGEVIVSIPVNVGIVGAVVGITAAKWAAKDTATNFVDQVKDAATSFISQIKETEDPAEDADFEQVVDESEPKE